MIAMRRLLLLLLLTVPLFAETNVTLLHFSDYHSHALPFYTDEGERGGIARAIGYLRHERRRGALVFSGGDMINKGAPAWSDKYQCAEWPWLNGIVDAMAFGNHEADYGIERFEQCRKSLTYPVLGANVPGLRAYDVLERNGIRIGVFAVAGPDFPRLVKGMQFDDPITAAREAVRVLRQTERVHAVVMIGHEHAEDDYALAKAVPGIDLIFGTHSHLKRELTRIPETETWFISPWQYLAWISRVELTFDGGKLTHVGGTLVPVDHRMREDRRIARRVRRMQRELERDPVYRELFLPIGELDAPLTVDALAQQTLQAMRSAAKADVAISTTSSFRASLPKGTLTMELLRSAMPYDNELVACTMSGAQVQHLLDAAGPESYVAAPAIDPAATYRVATTDYLANVAYKDVFVCERENTGLHVREELMRLLR